MHAIAKNKEVSLSKGFTLIELLVVIVLMGIVTSFTMLSLNLTGLESELDEEARKIHALIKLAKEDAIIQAQEVAFKTENNQYVFEYWDWSSKKWKPKEDNIFRERIIHEGLILRIESKAKKIFFKADDNTGNDLESGTIFFLSSGEQTLFTIKIAIKDRPQIFYKIEGDINGAMKIEKFSELDS